MLHQIVQQSLHKILQKCFMQSFLGRASQLLAACDEGLSHQTNMYALQLHKTKFDRQNSLGTGLMHLLVSELGVLIVIYS